MSAEITERPAPPIPTPLPDVIRLTVPAQYDGEDWTDFSADKTAEEVAAALRDRYPQLASVTLDESGGWIRVIERPSWEAPLWRYRLCGLDFVDAARMDFRSAGEAMLHVRLVRLGCDDPGPEEPPIVPPDEREPDDNGLIALVQRRAALQPTTPTEEIKPVSTAETPTEVTEADLKAIDAALARAARERVAADEAALAAASVPPKRSRTAPVAAPPALGQLAVTVAREPLRAALRTVVTAAVTGSRGAGGGLAVMANVLIDASPTAVSLTCTDLNQRLTVEVAASTETPGAYTVPGKLLSDLVNTFMAPDVTLRQDGEVLRVTSGKSRGHLKGIDAAEFPEDRQDSGDTCTLPAAVLRRALTLAAWAAARDESRPVLKCVGLAVAGGRLVAQAADGGVLSSWSVPLAGLPDFTALLPRDATASLARLLAAREGDVTLSLLPSAATPNVLRLALAASSAHGPEAVLSTRTGEGQSPDLLRVVPKTHTLAITVQRAALLGAVRQAGVVADRTPGRDGFRSAMPLNLRAEPGADGADPAAGALHVWSTNADVGEQRTEIAASISSAEQPWMLALHFKLDGTYLVDMLSALDEALDGELAEADDGAVTLRLTKELMPVRFGCAALPEWIGVVMPMSGGTE
jgi:DNA polymerase III sliding clamp (beta) subunit (PCNA family)